MADKSRLINELLDAIENLLIENRMYVAAIKQSSPQTQQLVHRLMMMAKNDPQLRATIHAEFAPFRNQSSEQSLQEILTKLGKKDVN